MHKGERGERLGERLVQHRDEHGDDLQGQQNDSDADVMFAGDATAGVPAEPRVLEQGERDDDRTGPLEQADRQDRVEDSCPVKISTTPSGFKGQVNSKRGDQDTKEGTDKRKALHVSSISNQLMTAL